MSRWASRESSRPGTRPSIWRPARSTSALYTGNTVVLKPSPLHAAQHAEDRRAAQGHVPARRGQRPRRRRCSSGQWMTEHPGIDKISFTGSVATGKKVMASAAGTLKRVTLELGGNDAAIVLDDVDPKAVAPKLFFAAFVNSGQVCMAVKRIYAHEKVYDALCAALAEEARKCDGRRRARRRRRSSARSRTACSTTRWSAFSRTRSAAGARIPRRRRRAARTAATSSRRRSSPTSTRTPPGARGAVRPDRAGAEVHGRRTMRSAAPTTRATG